MKRRNAIFLGSVFLMMLAGYVAWCWRGYYLRPSMTFSENLPPDAAAMMEGWHQQDPLWAPSPFSVMDAARRLSRPWEEEKSFICEVRFPSDVNTVVIGDETNGWILYYFLKSEEKWKGYYYSSGHPMNFP